MRGIDPETGQYFDDTKRYIDALPLAEADKRTDVRAERSARLSAPRRAAAEQGVVSTVTTPTDASYASSSASGPFTMDPDWLPYCPTRPARASRCRRARSTRTATCSARARSSPTRRSASTRPCDASKEQLLALRDILGFERNVIVQATCHGADNRAVVDALRSLGRARPRRRHRAAPTSATRNCRRCTRPASAACASTSSSAWSTPRPTRRTRAHRRSASRRSAGTSSSTSRRPTCPSCRTFSPRCRRTGRRRPHGPARRHQAGGRRPSSALFLELMDANEPTSGRKVTCPERLSADGPPAIDDVVPFARRLVEQFPDRVLWGTDWPHPNLKGHMPDDGVLVDFIPHIAPTRRAAAALLVDNPMRLYWGARSSRCHWISHIDDIPGTTVFDAEQARRGYHLNKFCMSLMKADNRAALQGRRARLPGRVADERGPEAGGTGARLQPHDRARRQHLFPVEDVFDRRQELSVHRGLDDRPHAGSLRRHDARRRALARRAIATPEEKKLMARITAGVSTTHVPAIGAAIDLGKTAGAVLGSRCSRATNSPGAGSPSRSRTS